MKASYVKARGTEQLGFTGDQQNGAWPAELSPARHLLGLRLHLFSANLMRFAVIEINHRAIIDAVERLWPSRDWVLSWRFDNEPFCIHGRICRRFVGDTPSIRLWREAPS